MTSSGDPKFSEFGPPQVTRDAAPDIVARYPGTIASVSAVLTEHDVIHAGGMLGEYDSEARTIVARLASLDGEPDVAAVLSIVHAEFVAWFGGDVAGPRDRYLSVARDVRDVWRRRVEG